MSVEQDTTDDSSIDNDNDEDTPDVAVETGGVELQTTNRSSAELSFRGVTVEFDCENSRFSKNDRQVTLKDDPYGDKRPAELATVDLGEIPEDVGRLLVALVR